MGLTLIGGLVAMVALIIWGVSQVCDSVASTAQDSMP